MIKISHIKIALLIPWKSAVEKKRNNNYLQPHPNKIATNHQKSIQNCKTIIRNNNSETPSPKPKNNR
jgi:hypothetical protein